MERTHLEVTLETKTSRRVACTADDFGEFFASMDDTEQVEVLRAMVKHMQPWSKQWDAIAIKLASNSELRHDLRTFLGL